MIVPIRFGLFFDGRIPLFVTMIHGQFLPVECIIYTEFDKPNNVCIKRKNCMDLRDGIRLQCFTGIEEINPNGQPGGNMNVNRQRTQP
jgi:hypothetical protein